MKVYVLGLWFWCELLGMFDRFLELVLQRGAYFTFAAIFDIPLCLLFIVLLSLPFPFFSSFSFSQSVTSRTRFTIGTSARGLLFELFFFYFSLRGTFGSSWNGTWAVKSDIHNYSFVMGSFLSVC